MLAMESMLEPCAIYWLLTNEATSLDAAMSLLSHVERFRRGASES
jgi:hypothetical protein